VSLAGGENVVLRGEGTEEGRERREKEVVYESVVVNQDTQVGSEGDKEGRSVRKRMRGSELFSCTR